MSTEEVRKWIATIKNGHETMFAVGSSRQTRIGNTLGFMYPAVFYGYDGFVLVSYKIGEKTYEPTDHDKGVFKTYDSPYYEKGELYALKNDYLFQPV